MKLINWELISQPMNWIIVALMLAIGTFGLHLIMHPGATLIPTDSGSGGPTPQ